MHARAHACMPPVDMLDWTGSLHWLCVAVHGLQALGAELHSYKDEGHFSDETFPDLLAAVQTKIDALLGGAA